MAMLAPPPSAFTLHECLTRPSSSRPQHSMWKSTCSQHFRCPSQLSHAPVVIKRRHGSSPSLSRTLPHEVGSSLSLSRTLPHEVGSSLSLSCLSRTLPHEVGSCAPKRFVLLTASATANSDQSPPSHEEDGEGAVGCCKDEGKVPPKKPSPEIEPGDVVQAQLRALRDNDFMTVFEFASPKNKEHTGPLSRFTDMIQGRAYNVMLGHKSAEVLSTLSVGPERFQQRVLITGSNGKQAIFSWSLSRQETDPFQDCWMTDSVHRDE